MLADAVHRAAPGVPVHAKAMNWTFLGDGDVAYGVDATLFGSFSDINGNDAVNFAGSGLDEFCLDEIQDVNERDFWPVVRPLLPYLALPENNATDLALELGTCMMRAAARAARMAGEDEPRRDAAQQQYNAACEVFKACATASGAGAGVIGRLKEGRCRVAMQQAQAAQPLLGQMAAPEPGDAMSGHYWLLRGELAFQAGHYSEAMDAALQVVCFDNKDVDTLPDALLLSARCYEKQPDPCRARDVYYEVARLFPRTDWSAAAMERLADIRKRGLPREPDPSAGEELRFRNADDMNRRVERLLKDEASQPAAGDPG